MALRSEQIRTRVRDPLRLAAVRASELLDTPPEAVFDDLTRAAALVVGAPFAFLTVVDDVRSYWKSSFGLGEGAPHENTVEESFCQYVVEGRDAFFIPDATLDPRTRDNPSVELMGVRAWAGVPLRAPNGEVLGSFCAVDQKPREWSERDIEVIRILGEAASRELALRGALRDEREARRRAESLANALQASLLPPSLIAVEGLDIAVRFRPAGFGATLAGDFYDVFASDDATWSIVLGDVAGKGVEAAKTAALARYTVNAAAMRRADPVDVLTWLNTTLASTSTEIFLTAIYGTLRRSESGWIVRLATGGHPPPIVRYADGSAESAKLSGDLIGAIDRVTIGHLDLHLDAGDAIVFYTDGVHEARDDAHFLGQDGVVDIVRARAIGSSADDLAGSIEAAALAINRGVASDDIAILVIAVPAKAR